MATKKIAVAVVHGVGSQKAYFSQALAARIRAEFADAIRDLSADPPAELQIRGVYWAKAMSDKEHALEDRLKQAHLRWGDARNISIDLGGDALAYQIGRQVKKTDPPGSYEAIHSIFASTLADLMMDTAADAPLVVISHSLGTVIASNYFYDLQTGNVPPAVKVGNTPIEQGQTLVGNYTMGSPIAVWSLRYDDFGTPIDFPPKNLLPAFSTTPKEWLNLYDPDDVIAYPLKPLNDKYAGSVTKDIPVNVGNILTMWNPASHTGYWTDRAVINHISDGLVAVWKSIN